MRYRDLAPKLFDNGWHNVIPLTNGKAPVFKWGPIQRRDMTETTLDWMVKKFGHAPRVGIVFGECRSIVGVDIDLEHEPSLKEVLAVADDTLPPTDYLRIGNPPKRLLLYRGRVKSVKPHPIEIFGSSGQCAAFGMHPKTKRDYYWPHASIEECGPDDLPEVTQDQINEFLDRCKRHTTPRTFEGQKIEWFDWDAYAVERRMYGVDAAARQVRDVIEGRRRLTLLSVTGWLVDQGYDPQDVGEFVDKWFPDRERTEEWSDPGANAAQMAYSAIEKWGGDKDWEMKDDK